MTAARLPYQPAFDATVTFGDVTRDDDRNGSPYAKASGSTISMDDGRTFERVVMAFGDAYSQVGDLIVPGASVRLSIRFGGGVVKIAGPAKVDAAPLHDGLPDDAEPHALAQGESILAEIGEPKAGWKQDDCVDLTDGSSLWNNHVFTTDAGQTALEALPLLIAQDMRTVIGGLELDAPEFMGTIRRDGPNYVLVSIDGPEGAYAADGSFTPNA
jgi:hypothetical protein